MVMAIECGHVDATPTGASPVSILEASPLLWFYVKCSNI